MTAIKTAGRVVVRVTATAGGDWQVVSAPTGFQGINASKFSDLDRIPGFVRFENGEDWEEYDGDDDESFLQILNTSAPVVIARPAVPFDSSNGGARVADASGEHTLVLEVGAASVKRFFRETNPTWKLLTGGDNTPSVADGRFFTTAGATSITRFDDMEKGQRFHVRRGDSDITIVHDGVNIITDDGADIVLTEDEPVAEFAEDNAGVARQLGNAFRGKWIDAGTIAASSGVITVKPGRRYQLSAGDSVTGIDGLRDGRSIQIVAPATGLTTFVDGGAPGSGQALELSGSDFQFESNDERVLTLTRFGSNVRIVGGAGALRNALASNDNGKGASLIGLEDSANLFTGTTVEAALAELAGKQDVVTVAESDVGGTADAITLTITNGPPLADGLALSFIPPAENTGAVTIDYNGGGAVALVDAAGEALSAGDLLATAPVFARYDSDDATWRLFAGGGAAGIEIVANIASLRADTGHDNGAMRMAVGTRKGLFVWIASDLSTEVGYETAGREGVYLAPTTGAAADQDGTNGAWVRAAYLEGADISAPWFGCVGDNATDDTAAATAALNFAKNVLRPIHFPAGVYLVDQLQPYSGMVIKGDGRRGALPLGTLFRPFSAGTAIFEYQNPTANLFGIEFHYVGFAGNFTAGCKGFVSASTDWYIARPKFMHCEFWGNLEVGCRGNFIFAEWRYCVFGQSGVRIAGEANTGILSIGGFPADSNHNRINFCQFQNEYFRYIEWRRGRMLHITHCDFEGMGTAFAASPLRFEGVIGVKMDNIWMERLERAALIQLASHTDTDTRNCLGFKLSDSYILFNATNDYIVETTNNNQEVSLWHIECYAVPAGCQMTNTSVRPQFGGIRVRGGSDFTDQGRALPEMFKSQGVPLTPSVGFVTPPSFTFYFAVAGPIVTVQVSEATGTSNAAELEFAAGSVPELYRPTLTQVCPARVRETGVNMLGAIVIAPDGSMQFFTDAALTGFANSGGKGLLNSTFSYWK